MKKEPFVTKAQLDEIIKTYPTPFHLYDEKGMRENMKALKEAFSWNKGYREYFAVKATPNPFLINILREYGCGCDCSSYTELMLSDAIGATGEDIMFSSNDTPAEEFVLADKLNAIINLDDITHIDFLEKAIGHIPETISCRYNPGGVFKMGTDIMDNPGDAKYGMTKEQMKEAFKRLKKMGAKRFGIHSFLASNTVSNEYYPTLAGILFDLAVELKEETGLDLLTVNDILPLSYSAIGFANETNLCIVGVADGTFSKSSSTVEEIKAGWYTKDEVKKLLKTELFAARTQSYCYLWSK